MVRKTDVADLSAGLLFCDPLFDPKIDQALPRMEVGEHVQQIVIDIICLQTLQLFIEKLVKIGIAFGQILRKFGCQVDLASMALGQKLAQSHFISRIGIGGIEIIDTLLEGIKHFAFCFFLINTAAFACETHAAIAKRR